MIITASVHFDMDGVLADFEFGKRRLLGESSPDLNKRTEDLNDFERAEKARMYDLMRADGHFYRTLPPMKDGIELFRELAGWDPGILTAAPSVFTGDGAMQQLVADDKWQWCQHYLAMTDRSKFVCTTSAEKRNYLGHVPGDIHILIDDREQNCHEWTEVGGVAILHRSREESLSVFSQIITQRHVIPASAGLGRAVQEQENSPIRRVT